jgi:hypothetical protein
MGKAKGADTLKRKQLEYENKIIYYQFESNLVNGDILPKRRI